MQHAHQTLAKPFLRIGTALSLSILAAGFAASTTVAAAPPSGESRAPVPPSVDPPIPLEGLSRVREGGTPYDPNQPLVPYAIELIGAGGVADAPNTGLIESPPEYGPTRGVLFQYGGGWTSVVTACVKALTANPNTDEIAYVVVSSQTVANTATTQFVNAGANMSRVVFLIHPNNSIWMRDYGPHFLWQNGTLAVGDSHYYPDRPLDNFIPTLVGSQNFGVPTYDIPLYYSGGNFQPGPNRQGFVTALINLDNPSGGGFNETFIRDLHDEFKGIDTLHIMPQLPFSVDGTGHIDMWMYLVDEDTVIISEFIPGSNGTAISVTNNAVPYMQALGFEVFRPKAWNAGGAHYTYANAFRVNNRIFIPVYGTALAPGGNAAYNDEDADALAKWQAAAGPGVEIVPIQCSTIIGASGAIHCIVKQVPRFVDTIPAAHVVAPAGGELWLTGATETIRWNATDTNNANLASVDLAYSLDGGTNWLTIANGIADSGAFNWTVPAGATDGAIVRVTARATDGDTAVAFSNPFRLRAGTATTYGFGSGAGVTSFGAGRQTTSWTAINGNIAPVTTALTTANYAAMATSNATGGDTDANRYITPAISAGSEATHVFRFVVSEAPETIDEILVTWEGYSDNCTQTELYVWNAALNQWGDGLGRTGQNRFLDNFAGNIDERMVGAIRQNIDDFIAADGSIRFLVYAERSNDETFHDFMSLTVKSADNCTGDLDGSGTVDAADLAVLLGAWGACAGCSSDFDGNGAVDGSDLAVLLGSWGGCP
jgi:agmatine deiminase